MSIIHSTFVEHQLCFCAGFVGGCREQDPFPALGLAASVRVCSGKGITGDVGGSPLSAPTSCSDCGAAVWSDSDPSLGVEVSRDNLGGRPDTSKPNVLMAQSQSPGHCLVLEPRPKPIRDVTHSVPNGHTPQPGPRCEKSLPCSLQTQDAMVLKRCVMMGQIHSTCLR